MCARLHRRIVWGRSVNDSEVIPRSQAKRQKANISISMGNRESKSVYWIYSRNLQRVCCVSSTHETNFFAKNTKIQSILFSSTSLEPWGGCFNDSNAWVKKLYSIKKPKRVCCVSSKRKRAIPIHVWKYGCSHACRYYVHMYTSSAFIHSIV